MFGEKQLVTSLFKYDMSMLHSGGKQQEVVQAGVRNLSVYSSFAALCYTCELLALLVIVRVGWMEQGSGVERSCLLCLYMSDGWISQVHC